MGELMEEKNYSGSFVTHTQVVAFPTDKSCLQWLALLLVQDREPPLQMVANALLLESKGEDGELIAFSSKQSLYWSGIFGGSIFGSASRSKSWSTLEQTDQWNGTESPHTLQYMELCYVIKVASQIAGENINGQHSLNDVGTWFCMTKSITKK